jgi:hypothetical protein
MPLGTAAVNAMLSPSLILDRQNHWGGMQLNRLVAVSNFAY